MALPQNPVRDCYQALAQQWDVETQLRGSQIHGFFLLRKKIDQDGSDRAFIEHVRHMPISGASPAAATPMSEDDNTTGANRQCDIGNEFDAVNGHFYGDVLHS